MLVVKTFLLFSTFVGVAVSGPAVPIQGLAVRQDNKLPNCDDRSQTYNGPYADNSGNIYCTNSERCVTTKLSGKSVCQERSESVSVSVGVAIEGVSLGADFTVTNSESRCVTADDSTACSWNDGQCHTIWTQQQILRQKGYRRQRCNWGNGDETQCMGDWEQTTPSDTINYGCGSKCTDTNSCGHTDGTPCL
ncbi:unnamed protein product [Fusarium langsethiae]|nr:unnamed protein product [Fusarium langsethiae]